MKNAKGKAGESANESPYAVWCSGLMDDVPSCGKQLLTEKQYEQQMDHPNRRWHCPLCGAEASWDDEHYERVMFAPPRQGAA